MNDKEKRELPNLDSIDWSKNINCYLVTDPEEIRYVNELIRQKKLISHPCQDMPDKPL